MSSIKLTWKEPREVCKREGNGDLISVHSPVEQGEIVTAQSNLSKNIIAILREKNYSAWNSHAPEIPSSKSFSYGYYDFCDYNHVTLGRKHQRLYRNHSNAKGLLRSSQKNPEHS